MCDVASLEQYSPITALMRRVEETDRRLRRRGRGDVVVRTTSFRLLVPREIPLTNLIEREHD
jgi:hypothetical protein